MKITFEAENEVDRKMLDGESTTIEHVTEFVISGVHVAILPRDFATWHGTFEGLIGRTYLVLKRLEMAYAKQAEAKGEERADG